MKFYKFKIKLFDENLTLFGNVTDSSLTGTLGYVHYYKHWENDVLINDYIPVKQLSDNIFYLLNNLNLRHNNRSKNSKNYKEYVAKMRKNQLEKTYDELYQMILLAILLLDNVSRTKKIKLLKAKIEDTKNGQTENAQ